MKEKTRARGLRLPALWAALLSISVVATAQDSGPPSPRIDLSGSLRTRFEWRDDLRFDVPEPFSEELDDEEILLTQVRLRLTWRASETVTFVAELQDARLFNESAALDDDATPNVLADDLDLHQAYFEMERDLRGVATRLRVGRQKLNLGAMRLVASLEWVNTARVWDAARLTVGEEDRRTLDVFVSRLVPARPGSFNDWERTRSRHWNSGFHGLYLTDRRLLEGGRWELYYLLRRESDVADRIHTLGTRVELHREAWDVHAELAWQGGRWGGLDHEAAAVHLEAGLRPGNAAAGRLHLAYNFASGDDDPDDGTHQTFDNLFPLNHAYYGAMDLFSWQNVHNLEAGWRGELRGLTLGVAHQTFWLAETGDAWYNAGGGVVRAGAAGAGARVGAELDLTLAAPFELFGRRARLEAGYGRFFAGDFVRQTGPARDADFFYLQTRVDF